MNRFDTCKVTSSYDGLDEHLKFLEDKNGEKNQTMGAIPKLVAFCKSQDCSYRPPG